MSLGDNIYGYYPVSPKDCIVWRSAIHRKEIYEYHFFHEGHIQGYVPYMVVLISVQYIDFDWYS